MPLKPKVSVYRLRSISQQVGQAGEQQQKPHDGTGPVPY